MLVNSGVSCTIAQCFVHLSSVTRSSPPEAPTCTSSLFGHSLTRASKDCMLSADLRLLSWGLNWRSTRITQSKMLRESQQVTRAGCALTWWSDNMVGPPGFCSLLPLIASISMCPRWLHREACHGTDEHPLTSRMATSAPLRSSLLEMPSGTLAV